MCYNINITITRKDQKQLKEYFDGFVEEYEGGIQGVKADIKAGSSPIDNAREQAKRFVINGCVLVYRRDIEAKGFASLEDLADKFADYMATK